MKLATRSPRVEAARPALERFRDDVWQGLRAPRKSLPCRYFYDQIGSKLFEQITELDEYYLTRTERSIMEAHALEMARCLGPHCLLIEYGSGSSVKTRRLLDHLAQPVGYVPIDVSGEFLRQSVAELAQEYPAVPMLPLCADFTAPLSIPQSPRTPARRAVYFPGSTLGNFTPSEALSLLRDTVARCGRGGLLLLGADLRKDPRVIEAAYNDAQGVTARFNRNLLTRINRELAGSFVVEQFDHRAVYNPAEGRVEVSLVSAREQQARVAGAVFRFAAGEAVHTEYSYKYDLEGLVELVQLGGFTLERVWTDPRRYFSVTCFRAP